MMLLPRLLSKRVLLYAAVCCYVAGRLWRVRWGIVGGMIQTAWKMVSFALRRRRLAARVEKAESGEIFARAVTFGSCQLSHR